MRVLFAVLCLLLSVLTGCGGGGSSDVGSTGSAVLSGQAVLGPLSGAIIEVSNLDGTIVASSTAQSSALLTEAGSFSLTIPDAGAANIYLVAARGGLDIDPTDSGMASTGIVSRGIVHAYVTDAQARAGNIIVNPLTEIIYQDIKLQYPEGLTTLTGVEWSTLLDAEAQKYLKTAGSYSDVLSFYPSVNKSNSKIVWDKVLSKLVAGIHAGDSSEAMLNRVGILNSSMLPVGTMLVDDGMSIEKLEDIGGDLVRTNISQGATGQVDLFEQKYIDDSGAVIAVLASKISSTKSYLQANISKAGHVLSFEGTTSLLNGLDFSVTNIGLFVSRLVSIEAIGTTSLNITLDKSLTEFISAKKLVFTIDGREPSAAELSVLLDDPVLTWNFVATESTSVASTIAAAYSTSAYPGTTLKILKDGTLFFEMPLSVYYKVSGILSDGEDLVAEGKRLLAKEFISKSSNILTGDAEGILTEGAMNLALQAAGVAKNASALAAKKAMAALDWYSQVEKANYLISDALPIIAEETFSSTRVELSGPMLNGNLVLGEEYSPIVFIHSVNDLGLRGTDAELASVTLSATYDIATTTCYTDCRTYTTPYTLERDIGTYEIAKYKGYMIIPASKVSFSRGVDPGDLPVLSLRASTKQSIVEKKTKYQISETPPMSVDFTASVVGSSVWLDASSSWILDGLTDASFASFSWMSNGVEIANGETAIVQASVVDTGDGVGEVTLVATGFSGVSGKKTMDVTLADTSWDMSRWEQVTSAAAFGSRAWHDALSFDGKMWVIGGECYSSECGPEYNLRDVWNSSDGELWQLVTDDAFGPDFGSDWAAGVKARSVVFQDKIWVVQGANNHIWNSSDGINWVQIDFVDDFPIVIDSFISFNGKLYVFGDRFVWSSSNGIDWESNLIGIQDNEGLSDYSVLVFSGKMWIIYTVSHFDQDLQQFIRDPFMYVDSSTDGNFWTSESVVDMPLVFNFNTISYDGMMWIIGGHLDGGDYTNNVWTSSNGQDWSLAFSDPGFDPRMRPALTVFNNKLWFLGGYFFSSDVWRTPW